MSKSPLITSHVYKMALDFVPTGKSSLSSTTAAPPILAVCTSRFHAALPPLICCTARRLPLSTFLLFNHPEVRCPSMDHVFSLDIDYDPHVEREKRAPAAAALEWNAFVENWKLAPLPYLSSLVLSAVSSELGQSNGLHLLVCALSESPTARGLRFFTFLLMCGNRYDLLPETVQLLGDKFPSLATVRFRDTFQIRNTGAFVSATGAADSSSRRNTFFPAITSLHVTTFHPEEVIAASFFPQLRHLSLNVSNRAAPLSAPLTIPPTCRLERVDEFFDGLRCGGLPLDISELAPTLQKCGDMFLANVRDVVNPGKLLDFSGFEQLTQIGYNFLENFRCANVIDPSNILKLPPNLRSIGGSFLSSATVAEIDTTSLRRPLQSADTEYFGSCSELRRVDTSFLLGTLAGDNRVSHALGVCFLSGCDSLVEVDLAGLRGVKEIGDHFLSETGSLVRIKSERLCVGERRGCRQELLQWRYAARSHRSETGRRVARGGVRVVDGGWRRFV